MTTSSDRSQAARADGGCPPVVVSRRIEAAASDIFAIVADPARHTEIDGSGMLRGVLSGPVVSQVGDVFVMKMYLERLGGDYEMANEVVEFVPDRQITWEPRRNDIDEPSAGHRWGFVLDPDGDGATVVTETFDCARWPADGRAAIEDGRIWIDAMTRTLQRLDEVCVGG